ncbi:MAG: carboxypeptidase regulatory-like domain-containing protein [Nitrospinae bacterium]|nr:carboxypeptidase regulatory-like domain-containing protein [Nitrospinota bacterium]
MKNAKSGKFKGTLAFLVLLAFLAVGIQTAFGENGENGGGGEGGDDSTHKAGQDCMASGCHPSTGGEKPFTVGGTVYMDPDGLAKLTGATVKIVDANKKTITLASDSIGNIYQRTKYGTITYPYTVSVSYQGREVKMLTLAQHGSCNAVNCHITGRVGRVFVGTNDLPLTGTVTEAASGGTSTEISYTNDIKKIFSAKCNVCHKPGGARSVSPLTTYAYATASNLVTPGLDTSLMIRKLTQSLGIGTMWPYLNNQADFQKISDWIVKYNAQEFSTGQTSTSGAVVSRATVELWQSGRKMYSANTNARGSFTIKKVKAGSYTVKAAKKGYQAYTQDYQMNQSNVSSLDIQLSK